MTKFFLIFTTSLVFFASVAWASGYNFDTRTPAVGVCFGASIIVSMILGGLACYLDEDT